MRPLGRAEPMATEQDDEALYSAWERGDLKAADKLIGRHLHSVGRFLANKVVNAADAEDMACKVFEVCARRLGTFERKSSFRTYLFGIAHNVLRDYIKLNSRKKGAEADFDVMTIFDLGPSPSAVMGHKKEQALLLRALRAIPLSCQIVIELSFFEEMTQIEIAELLDLPPGTVASRLRRGKIRLDAKIEELAESLEVLTSTQHGLQDWAADLKAQIALFAPKAP